MSIKDWAEKLARNTSLLNSVNEVLPGPGITCMAASSNFIRLLPTVLVTEANTPGRTGSFRR